MTAQTIGRLMTAPLRAVSVGILFIAFTCTGGWAATPELTFRDVHRLLRSNDFAALNDSLDALARSAMELRGSSRPVLDLLVETTSSAPEIEAALQRWVEAFPASCHALTALGLQRSYLFTLRHGSVAAGNVPAKDVVAPFESAIDADPQCVTAYAGAARALENGPLARDFVQNGLDANPRSVLLRTQQWRIQVQEGTLQWDDMDVSQHHADDSDSVASSALRREIDIIAAIQLAQEQRPAEAALRYAAALEGWEVPAYRIARAEFYEELEWFDEARREYLRILELNADHRLAHTKAIRGAMRLDRQTAALVHAERALLHDPRNPDVLIQKARLLAQIGETDEATKVIEAALDLGGERPEIAADARAIMTRYDLEDVGPLLTKALSSLQEDPIVVVENALAECMPAGCALAVVLQALAEECQRFSQCDGLVANTVKEAMRQQQADASAAHARLTSVLDRLQSAHN